MILEGHHHLHRFMPTRIRQTDKNAKTPPSKSRYIHVLIHECSKQKSHPEVASVSMRLVQTGKARQ
ncbi:hypothetical protein ABIE32_002202 [Comamonas sp. 4034]